jgi:hypothetical protein
MPSLPRLLPQLLLAGTAAVWASRLGDRPSTAQAPGPGAATYRVVVSETFVLEGTREKSTVVLGFTPPDGPALQFRNRMQDVSLRFGLVQEGLPALSAQGPQSRVLLSLLRTGARNLQFVGGPGEGRLDVFTVPGEFSSSTVAGPLGKSGVSFTRGVGLGALTCVELSDGDGKTRIRLADSSQGTQMNLWDTEGRPRTIFGVTPQSNVHVSMLDRTRSVSLRLGLPGRGKPSIKVGEAILP